MEFDANLKYHTTLVADDEFLLTGALDYSLCTETVRPDIKYKYNLDIYGLR